MSDLDERFRSLARDAEGRPAPKAAEIRRSAERHRLATRLLTAGVGLGVALTAVGLVVQETSGAGRDRVLSDSPSPSGSPPPAPGAERPWLPAPWAVVALDADSWSTGQQSPPLFCGIAMTAHTRVSLTGQVLQHPSGQTARLVMLSPDDSNEPMQLFKFSYASCLEKGNARSVEGPRNLWSYDNLAGGSEIVDGSLHQLELRAAPGAGAPSRGDVEATLDLWANR